MLLSLVCTGLAMLVAESLGKESATVFTDWIFLPIPAALVVLSVVTVKKHGLTGDHGKAWIFFTIFAVCWFMAEQVWTVCELVYHQKPFPSGADLFYIAGYPAYFVFSLLYLKPFKDAVSRKKIILASAVAISLLIPTLYMTLENNTDEDQLSVVLGAFYPVADAIVLVPAMIGVMLFLGGRVSFLWSLVLIGILLEVVADTGFQYISLDGSYYTGHPVDILFLWSYIVFSFGVYDHIKVFKNKKRFDQEMSR